MPASVLTLSPRDRAPLRDALAGSPLLVVGLCAAWCDTCRTFFDDFDGLARRSGDAAWVWLDVEDDAEVVGDIDVENFPTLAVYRDGRLVHFGVSLPQAGLVSRLLQTLTADSATIDGGPAAHGLPARLAARAATTG